MPIKEDAIRAYLREVAMRLDAAEFRARGAIVAEATAFLGWSPAKVYRQLARQVGWDSGRPPRADKGSTRQDMTTVEFIAGLQREAVRKNGKATMHLPTAASIAAANGKEVAVSAGRLGRVLRDRRLDVKSQQHGKAHVRMRSLHPNHVHQADPSLCLIYYLQGAQYIIRDDEFYKNKLDRVAKIQQKVWRYVLTDHTSGVIVPWYVEAAGETQTNLFEFLLFAWSRQPGRPCYGVPQILVWDKGSANGSHAIRNVLSALEVRDIPHAKGNPRAKGSVENANNIVETHFECRLRFEPVETVEQLNRAAFAWANAYNADAIPGVDCRLRRPGMQPTARYDLWMRIMRLHNGELRELPDPEVCRALLTGKPATRRVNRGLEIAYKHPQADCSQVYDVSGLKGVAVGDEVEVSPLLYGRCAVMIRVASYNGAPFEYRLEPLEFDAAFGFRADAPVFGEEFKARPDTDADRAGKRLDRLAYPGRDLPAIERARDRNDTPFEGAVDAHSHLSSIDIPTYLGQRGAAINVPDRVNVETKPLTHAQAAIKLRAILGEVWTRELFERLVSSYPEGVLEEELDRVAAQLRGSEPQAARLQAVK